MWLVPKFTETLMLFVNLNIIGEVIIINNNRANTPDHLVLHHPKIKMHNFPENIYVNPAFNYGVAVSAYNKIALINDDIFFDLDVFNIVDKLLDNAKIIAVNLPLVNKNGEIKVAAGQILVDKFIPGMNLHHFGCLMFMNKIDYIPIPAGLNVYYGDTWLWELMYNRYDQNYLIYNFQFETQASTTCNKLPDREWIYQRESHLANKYWTLYVNNIQ